MRKTQNLSNQLKIKITKRTLKLIGIGFAAFILAGLIFFFNYFKVRYVEVMDSSHYSESELREMILQGWACQNSVLAPIFCSTDDVGDIPFVEGFRVKQMNRNTIVISVKEKQPVGCIPYLDSYVYFDRNGIFVESSRERAEKIPYFDGIQVDNIVMNEKLPIKGKSILNTAVALSIIFQKSNMLPDHIAFDENNQISLIYGEITVQLGGDKNLENKMAKAFAILPKITGKKGILHLESDSDSSKPTFEEEIEKPKPEDWKGGYDENGEYTEDGEYDEEGNYVGPRPEGSSEPDSDGDTAPEESYEDTYEDAYGDSYDEAYDEAYGEDDGDSYE